MDVAVRDINDDVPGNIAGKQVNDGSAPTPAPTDPGTDPGTDPDPGFAGVGVGGTR